MRTATAMRPAAMVIILFLPATMPKMFSGRAQNSPSNRPPMVSNALVRKIDAIFAPLMDAHSPGFAALVLKNGEKIFERGYGLRALNSPEKIDALTNFRLASCSKQFTAMSIMLLVHDGKIRYDQTLTDIFPEFPAYGKTITVRNLLNHVGGLQDYETLMDEAAMPSATNSSPKKWTEEKQIQDAEVVALLEHADHGIFAPGTQWYYSNSGYVILGLVVAKVSGKPFREFLRERIFEPLRMDHTVAYERGKNEISNRAYGHTKEGANWKRTDQSSTSATLGDGGIYSSLEDLAKWDEALRTNKLLGREEMQPALTPFHFANSAEPQWPANSDRPEGSPALYGFGWFLDPYKSHARMWHYGETVGFHSYIVRFADNPEAHHAAGSAATAYRSDPLTGTTIIVLCNRTDISPEKLALQIADLLANDAT